MNNDNEVYEIIVNEYLQDSCRNLYKEAYEVNEAAKIYGGSFKRALFATLPCADLHNMQKIKQTWLTEWNDSLKLYKNLNREEE
jgi:hypothetical protein